MFTILQNVQVVKCCSSLQNDCNLVTKCLGYEICVTKCLIAKHLKIQKL